MAAGRTFLNDTIADCGVAACCNAILLWGHDISDADALIANDRFSAADYNSKVLWGWWRRGIGSNFLGGFATIRFSQLPAAVAKFGCAWVAIQWPGVGNHAVLVKMAGDGVTFRTWGYDVTVSNDDFKAWLVQAFAIAPKFSPRFIWYALTNNPRWFLFLAPLWWPR